MQMHAYENEHQLKFYLYVLLGFGICNPISYSPHFK